MRSFWRTVVSTTCGLAILLIGGASYSSGQEKAADQETEVLKLIREAANKGDAAAQTSLGLMYALGVWVPQDYAEAARWFRKAAEQGDTAAQFNLGRMYYQGHGVPRDYVEAHMWLNLAASRDSGDYQKRAADTRQLAASMMTPQQIAEAQRRAREWKPKTGEDKGGKPTK